MSTDFTLNFIQFSKKTYQLIKLVNCILSHENFFFKKEVNYFNNMASR